MESGQTDRAGARVRNPGSVTRNVQLLKAGRDSAAARLWPVFFPRMVGLARGLLGQGPKHVADEEDVALDAFHSFCVAIKEGRLHQTDGRHSLWVLLATFVARKTADVKRRAYRQKRGGHLERQDETCAVTQPDPGPPPDVLAMLNDAMVKLITALERSGDDDLKRIAIKRLEGHSIKEVAELIGVCRKSIERKLRLIEKIWQRQVEVDE